MPLGAAGALLLASSLAWEGAALTSGTRQESQSHGGRAAAAAESAAEHGQFPPILPIPFASAPLVNKVADGILKASVIAEVGAATMMGEAVKGLSWLHNANKQAKKRTGLASATNPDKEEEEVETGKAGTIPGAEDDSEAGQEVPSAGTGEGPGAPEAEAPAPQASSVKEAQQVLQDVRTKLQNDIKEINATVLEGAAKRSEIAKVRLARAHRAEACALDAKRLNATKRQLLVIKAETTRTIAAMEEQVRLAKDQIRSTKLQIREAERTKREAERTKREEAERTKKAEEQKKREGAERTKREEGQKKREGAERPKGEEGQKKREEAAPAAPTAQAAGVDAGEKPSDMSTAENDAAEDAEAQRAKAEGVSLRELILTLQAENLQLEKAQSKTEEEHADRVWEFTTTGRKLAQETAAVQVAHETTARLEAQIVQLQEMLRTMYKPGKSVMPLAEVEAQVNKMRYQKNHLVSKKMVALERQESMGHQGWRRR